MLDLGFIRDKLLHSRVTITQPNGRSYTGTLIHVRTFDDAVLLVLRFTETNDHVIGIDLRDVQYIRGG